MFQTIVMMTAELSLVTELAIILISAALFTIIFKALKQPLILGYIIAGFIVGPNLGLFPQFSAESVHDWSELGIIFLLFGLGLEFSFKKLVKIGASAFITAGVKCIGMFAVGILAGKAMGWTTMESIFLGGMLGMSSTTIIIKAYGDMGLKNKSYSSLVFGSLVFEDLIAVLLLVLLSTLAVTGEFAGKEMVWGITRLMFFIVLWFLVGIFLIPLVLKKARKYLDDEIALLVGIGLCFGMVVVANAVGFSSALGAFVMGSILAETMEGARFERVTTNIKDLFGAVFFVSVGMMVDPVVIGQHWLTILIITVIAMSGILVFSTLGSVLAGQGLSSSVHAGFSLAQLGEFAFIIAGLGCDLGVLRSFIYPVIIAVSVLTTFTTPYMIRLGDPAAEWLQRILPARLVNALEPEESTSSSSKAEKSEWRQLLQSFFLRFGLFGVLVVAIMIASAKLMPMLMGALPFQIGEVASHWLSLAIELAVLSPFLYGLSINGSSVAHSGAVLLRKDRSSKWSLMALVCLRSAFVAFVVISVIDAHFTLVWWIYVLLLLAFFGLVLLVAIKSAGKVDRLTSTFMDNLNARDNEERRLAPVSNEVKSKLSVYDVSLQSVTINPDFSLAGKPLRDMPFRKYSGANVIKIQRGTRSIVIPRGDEPVLPGDVLLAVGTSEQLERFKESIDEHVVHDDSFSSPDFVVESIVISESSSLYGKSLRESDMRTSGCMAVSVIRDGKIITNPKADFVFRTDDIVWLAGEKDSVDWFRS